MLKAVFLPGLASCYIRSVKLMGHRANVTLGMAMNASSDN